MRREPWKKPAETLQGEISVCAEALKKVGFGCVKELKARQCDWNSQPRKEDRDDMGRQAGARVYKTVSRNGDLSLNH